MKHYLSYTFGLIIVGLVGIVSGPCNAATTAAGPYYATPSWDQTLPATTRFIVLSNMGSAAVLDRETGLVWEKSPSATSDILINQASHCNTLVTGGRLGWRLPSIQELASLVDPTQSNPSLPSGSPFTNVQSSPYWSATTVGRVSAPFLMWVVDFFDGSVSGPRIDGANFAWCVRGGPGSDAQ